MSDLVGNPEDCFLASRLIVVFASGGNVLESRIASMLPNLALGTSTLGSKFKPIPPAASSAPQPGSNYSATQATTKSATEDNSDERAATPVMDEQEEETKEATPPRAKTPEKSKPVTTASTATLKTNPIDFLSQLLTKTTKSSSSSNFLHSLSLLTNTVKSQYQQKQSQSEASSLSDQPKSMMDSSYTTAPVSDNASQVSVAPSPVEAPLTSSWSGWQMNAAHPPLPPGATPDQPPPPLPLGVSPAYPPPQMPPQPTSPLGTPYPAPPSTGYQPHGSEGYNPVTTPGTYTAPGTQPFPVASRPPTQPAPPEFIDPSLPPPPPTTQFQSAGQQQFPTSPDLAPPQPPMQVLGPRPGFPPTGEPKSFNPTAAVQQLLFSYGGARNPPPPQQGQTPTYPPTSRPWDQPPPGPPPEPSPTSRFPPPSADPYGPWSSVQKSEPQSAPIGPPQVSTVGPSNQFPGASPYRTWPPVQPQQDSNNQPPQDTSPGTGKSFTPWDQPDKYPDQWEQPDMELESPPPEPEPAPNQPHTGKTPAKGILRNRSSLREVQLVDETNDTAANNDYSPGYGGRPLIGMATGDRIPVGILKKPSYSSGPKKPPTDIVSTDQPTDVQSEFIAKLKRKTGGGNLVVPPVMSHDNGGFRNNFSHGRDHSNLTTVQLRENQVEQPDPNVHNVILEEVQEAEPGDYDPETAFGGHGAEYAEQEDLYQEVGEANVGENEPEATYEEGGPVDHREELRRQFENIGGQFGNIGGQFENVGGQFENHGEIGEPISTIGVLGDRESRSSMDMDLESLEENQPPEHVENQAPEYIENQPPEHVENQMPEVEKHEPPPVESVIERHMPHEGPHGDHWEYEKRNEPWRASHDWGAPRRPPRPRFDNFRPREPFSPYHRPYSDRPRGPRPRNFNPRHWY